MSTHPTFADQNLVSMKKMSLLLVVLGLFSSAFSQNFSWAKKIGGPLTEYGKDIEVDGAENVFTVGTYQMSPTVTTSEGTYNLTASGGQDVFISKNDANGNFLWIRTIGGASGDDGVAIELDAASNSYITGYFQSTVDFDPGVGVANLTSFGSQDIYVLKLDSNGNFLWVKQLGGTGSEGINGLEFDSNGNILLTGTFSATADFDPGVGVTNLIPSGSQDVFVCKLNNIGDFIWAKQFGNASTNSSTESVNDLAIDATNNIYLTGLYFGTVDFNPNAGIFNLVATSLYESYILKLNELGDFVFAKKINGTTVQTYTAGKSIAIDNAGNIITSGAFTGLSDFDPGVGTYNMTSGGFNVTIYILKLENDGDFVWAKQFTNTNVISNYGLELDANNNAYLTGHFEGTVDFAPGPAVASKTSAGGRDIYFVKLNAAGNLSWAQALGSTGFDMGLGTTVDASNHFYGTGYFYNTVDFNPGVGVNTLSNTAGNGEAFILKWGDCQPDTVVQAVTACSSYTWINGVTYTTSTNSPIHTLTNVAGCDSTIHLNLTINAPSSSVDVVTACGSYTWMNGITYTASNSSATHQLTNAAGCDSTITLNLTLNAASTTTQLINACEPYTWINGVTYYASTSTPTVVLTNYLGCDSIITLNLTMNQHSYVVNTITACDNYTWIDGINYTSSTTTPQFTLTNSAGCDSIITLHLTINYATTSTETVTACDAYTWINCVTYTTSANNITHVIPNAVGCDSIITLNLTILPSSNSTDVVVACGSHTWMDGITYYSSTSTPSIVLTNQLGCDSIVTLDLTINQPSFVINTITACDNYTWIDGINYTSSTSTPQHILTNSASCDSILILHLTINHASSSTETVTACGSYTWVNGFTYTASTTNATYTIPNSAGCDSIITLHLTIRPTTNSTDVVAACSSYIWMDGVAYTSSNTTATHLLTNVAGCDSLVTLNLTIYPPKSTYHIVQSCESYTWIDGINYSTSTTTPTYVLQAASGCDSIIYLNLTVNDIDTSLTVNGNTITANQSGASYEWINCDNGGQPIPGETNQTLVTGIDGNYAVRITLGTCTELSRCVKIGSLNINVTDFEQLMVFPNPTFDLVNIETDLLVESIHIFNTLGQIVQIESSKIFSMKNLSTGTYVLKIKTDTGVITRQLIKE